ncbi:O-antigen ligase family protein [Enterococcus hirae]
MFTKFSKQFHSIGQKIALPYIVFFELVLICRMVSVYSTLPPKIDSIFSMIIMLLSGVIFLSHFLPMILEKKKIKIEYWLIVFIVILAISTLLNREYAFTENIKLIIWQCIFFFCVFEVGRENNKKLFTVFETILLVVWSALVLFSLYLFFARVSFSTPVKSLYYGMRIGFFENRLYGIFVDPNYATTISLVCIIFALRKAIFNQKLWVKVLSIFVMFVQFSYISLSGSRSGMIQLVVAAFFGVFFFYLFYQSKKNQSLVLKVVGATVLAAISSAVVFGGVSLMKTGYVNVANRVEITSPKVVDFFEKDSEKKISDEKLVTTERPDVVENKDISNSRFALWKSATELMRLEPIFGTTPKGFVAIAKAKIPETHIAKTGQTPHSAFFYLLAATGISGTIVFVLFLLSKMWQSLRILFATKQKNYLEFLIDNQIVLIILVSSLLITEIILTRRSATFIFWLYLGKLQYDFDQQKHLNRLEK